MKLMVLDGNSLVNRAFFGIKLLTTKDGRYTNAIYGFQNILLNLLAAHKPDAVAIAWDERAPTFRHTAYDGYKATRHGMPEELAQQMPVLKELLTDLGFVQVSKAGWEADDILGTLAAACEAAGGTTLLATGDRDSLQLVDDATTVLLATNKETIPMDPAAIREKYGIEPPQLIDVKSLMGDASDNIPGVPGIGEKTALALISKFGSLQGVYDNIDDKAVKPGQRAKLTANRDKADLSYMLGTIRKDAPIETDPAAAAQLLACGRPATGSRRTGCWKSSALQIKPAGTWASQNPASVWRASIPTVARAVSLDGRKSTRSLRPSRRRASRGSTPRDLSRRTRSSRRQSVAGMTSSWQCTMTKATSRSRSSALSMTGKNSRGAQWKG